MALFNKVGSILRQTSKVNASVAPAPMSSMLNTIRCMSSMKLFVGGLSYGTDDHTLKDAFSGFGEVIEEFQVQDWSKLPSWVITDRESGRSRGFGFVSFSSSESASSALSAMDGQALLGRNIRVSFAEERSGPPRGNYTNFGGPEHWQRNDGGNY